MINIERNSLFHSSMSIIITTIIITTSIIILEIALNNHHTSIAQQQQQENKSLVVAGVHSPELEFEKNPDNVGNASQMRVTHPVMVAGMMENHTITTIKLNVTKFQQNDRSQFTKATEFAQISVILIRPITVQLHSHPLRER